jgi:general stress protein CsbA
LACAIVAFVLSMLCLFAGHKPGFMEEYHIVTVWISSTQSSSNTDIPASA